MSWHRHTHLWLFSYVRGIVARSLAWGTRREKLHVMFCVADHFEPFVRGADRDTAMKRVLRWQEALPRLAEQHAGSDGRKYRHTFFYPIEQYDERLLDVMADLCRSGYGEVEFHLHHDGDTGENLQKTLLSYKRLFAERHGLLSKERNSGEVKYGFIHGNWALDNSRPDGKWCGVNQELKILSETGCFGDFTMPSAPDVTQTSKINSIYYAVDNPDLPKSHDRGVDVQSGKSFQGDLLLIQGPLALSWSRRKNGLFPSIENGELGGGRPPDLNRFKLWVNQHIHVKGRRNWIFVKVHTHGALERNAEMMLGPEMVSFLKDLETLAGHEDHLALHFVTAREMYNIIKAAEEGLAGNPEDYRDYRLLPVSGLKSRRS